MEIPVYSRYSRILLRVREFIEQMEPASLRYVLTTATVCKHTGISIDQPTKILIGRALHDCEFYRKRVRNGETTTYGYEPVIGWRKWIEVRQAERDAADVDGKDDDERLPGSPAPLDGDPRRPME